MFINSKVYMTFIIGKHAKHNWEILDNASPDDYFFHLSSFPSPYVIFTSIPTRQDIIQGAQLCREHSKYKNFKNVKVDYCPCSNLKKGNKTGEVVYISKVKQIKI